MLQAWSYLNYKNNKVEINNYWDVSKTYNSSISKKNYAEIKTDIKDLFFNAVGSRLVADVVLRDWEAKCLLLAGTR